MPNLSYCYFVFMFFSLGGAQFPWQITCPLMVAVVGKFVGQRVQGNEFRFRTLTFSYKSDMVTGCDKILYGIPQKWETREDGYTIQVWNIYNITVYFLNCWDLCQSGDLSCAKSKIVINRAIEIVELEKSGRHASLLAMALVVSSWYYLSIIVCNQQS